MTFSWSHHPYACDDSDEEAERPTVAVAVASETGITPKREEGGAVFSPLPTPGSCTGAVFPTVAEAVEPTGPLTIQVTDLHTSVPAAVPQNSAASPYDRIQSPVPPVQRNQNAVPLYVTTPQSPPEGPIYQPFNFQPIVSPTVDTRIVYPPVYADPAAYSQPQPTTLPTTISAQTVPQTQPAVAPYPGGFANVPPALVSPASVPPALVSTSLPPLPSPGYCGSDAPPPLQVGSVDLLTPTDTPKEEISRGFQQADVSGTFGSQGIKTPSEEHFVISPRRFDPQDVPQDILSADSSEKPKASRGKKKKKCFLAVEFKWGVTAQVHAAESIPVGTHVLVARQRGLDMGMVTGVGKGGGGDEVVRLATAEEVEEWKTEQKRLEAKIVRMVRRLAQVHQVPLRIHFCGLQFDKRRVTIHYSSEQTHPDFRRLVAACHSRLRCSIWMNNCRPAHGAPGERVPDNHPGFPVSPPQLAMTTGSNGSPVPALPGQQVFWVGGQ